MIATLPRTRCPRPHSTSLTVQHAKELREDGILVNAAAPGTCATDVTKDLPFPITRTGRCPGESILGPDVAVQQLHGLPPGDRHLVAVVEPPGDAEQIERLTA